MKQPSNTHRKRSRKYDWSHAAKLSEPITSYVYCWKCDDSKIPVNGIANANAVLRGHLRQCTSSKVNRKVTVDDVIISSHDCKTFANDSTALEVMDMASSETIAFDSTLETIQFIACVERSWFQYQLLINKSYKHDSMKINKGAQQSRPAKIQDTLSIFEFSLKHQLNNKAIDNLLQLFKDIHDNNGIDLSLPNNNKTLRRQCGNGIISCPLIEEECLFNLRQLEYRLESDTINDCNKCITAFSYDIMQIISEELLNIDPSKFITNPDDRYVDTAKTNKIFEDYTAGFHFKNLTDAVRCQNPGHTALCIGFTLDDTQVLSGKRDLTPVHMFILNCIDESFKMILVGYAPGGKLPYNNQHITNAIYEQYPRVEKTTGRIRRDKKQGVIKDFIRFQLRKLQRDYLYDVFKPILDTQEHGVLLRVGRFDNPLGFEINANIHLVVISGDNLQLENLTSTNFRSSTYKCRICMSDNTNAINFKDCIGEFRDDDTMQQVGHNMELALKTELKRMQGNPSKQTKQSFADGKRYGLKAGYNKLIDLFKWQNDRGINSFFKSLVPDYLHTVTKGMIEDVIAWSGCCLMSLKDYDSLYAANMHYLDERIKSFPIIQSLVIFPNRKFYRWSEGVSHLFKGSWRSKGTATTGFFASGSIEGWKLPQLLFQLTFCLNSWICPFDSSWSNGKLKKQWNVGNVLVNAMVSAIELHFICRMKVLSTQAIEQNLLTAITNARAHSGLLRLLKEDLMTGGLKCTEYSVDDTEYGGIKHHLLAHLLYYKKEFGADPRATDTELSERAHKGLKVDFEHTNKQYSRVNMDMLLNNRKTQYFHNKLSNTTVKLIVEELSPTDSDMHYRTLSTQSMIPELVNHENKVRVLREVQISKRFAKGVKTLRQYTCDSNGINKLLISFNGVINIADTCTDEEFREYWKRFKDGSMCCKLLKDVECRLSRNDKSPGDYHIHCNSKYIFARNYVSSKPRNVCDFVEVKCADISNNESTEFARVVAMFCFQSTNDANDEKVFILICWMKKLAENLSILPYPLYGYEIERSKLNLQIVSIECVIRPAFMVSHSKKSCLRWDDIEQYELQQLKSHTFYCVPYSTVVRDYCQGFVSYFNEIRNNNNDIFNELPINISSDQQREIDAYMKSIK